MAWLLGRSLAHVEWMRCIGMLSWLARYHHLGEAHLLLVSSLHGLHLGLLDPVLVSVYQLLLRRCRVGRLSLIELVAATGGEWRSSSLHNIVWGRSTMLMLLLLLLIRCSRVATSHQMVLHPNTTSLRHMESVARLLLLWLLLVHGVHLVLLGTATCIRRSLTKVLRRTGTSLLSRRVSGEPRSWVGRRRVSPWTLGWALIGGISP